MSNKRIKLLLFSRKRALQCHAMLESILRCAPNLFDIDVLVKEDTEKDGFDHHYAYQQLFDIFNKEVTTIAGTPIRFFYEGKSFKGAIQQIIKESPHKLFGFITDDCILHDTVPVNAYESIEDAFEEVGTGAFSLRYGLNTKHQAYWVDLWQPELNCNYHRPDHESLADFIYWDTKQYGMEWNWSWLISLDGHIFDKEKLQQAVEQITFNEIHHFEHELHPFKGNLFSSTVASFLTSKLVCLSYNYVSDPNTPDNFAKHYPVTAEELVKKYLDGYKFDLDKMLENAKIQSCHTELPLFYKPIL